MLKSEQLADEINTLEQKYSKKLEVAEWLNRKLVSNQGNREVAFLNWFGLKEGFSYDLVLKLIRLSKTPPSATFLDPFSGAGTSIFAAANSGMKAIGIELLPIGKFLHETRLAAFSVNVETFEKEVRNVIDLLKQNKKPLEKYRFGHIPITEGAFSEETESHIAFYLEYVDQVQDDSIKQLLRFACFSILEDISYTSKDGQYLRWDKRSGRTRAGDYKKRVILSFPEAISNVLTNMVLTIKGRTLFWETSESPEKLTTLINGSALENLPQIASNSVDLVISSPPYCNRYDYTRTYALELAFLGINNENLKKYRQQLLSCTVENKSKDIFLKEFYGYRSDYEFYESSKSAFFDCDTLQSILGALKYKMEQGELNNDGIYGMVYNYFFEHSFVIHELARVMKQGGKIFYINDNVQYAGVPIPVDLILSEFAETFGLEVSKIYYLKRGKGNSSQQMGTHGREEQRKCVYFWEKK